MKKLKFRIKGMDCQVCAMLIEGELRETPGVEETKVDYNSNEATVVYDELLVNELEIFKIVEELGNYSCDKINEEKNLV